MREILNDLRIAIRRLRHSPGFVLVTVLSLTMAIAANLVVFGVMNAAILRPLNVGNADRLWMVVQKPAKYITQSYPDYLDFRARNTTFGNMAAYRFSEAGLSTQGVARKNWTYEISGNYFDMLGVQPELGRLLHSSDEHGPNSAPYGPRVQVLRAALGRTVLLLGIGSVAGLALGVLGSRVLASVVYEATVYDPVVLVGAIAAMVLIGSMAAAVPARRAVNVEPAVLLREE